RSGTRHLTGYPGCAVGYLGRVERRKSSRVIDAISDLLGREATFATVVMCDVVALAVVVAVGIGDTPVVSAISLFVSLATLVMVCAVQHTSSRESKALNLKMDELIRVSEARTMTRVASDTKSEI